MSHGVLSRIIRCKSHTPSRTSTEHTPSGKLSTCEYQSASFIEEVNSRHHHQSYHRRCHCHVVIVIIALSAMSWSSSPSLPMCHSRHRCHHVCHGRYRHHTIADVSIVVASAATHACCRNSHRHVYVSLLMCRHYHACPSDQLCVCAYVCACMCVCRCVYMWVRVDGCVGGCVLSRGVSHRDRTHKLRDVMTYLHTHSLKEPSCTAPCRAPWIYHDDYTYHIPLWITLIRW